MEKDKNMTIEKNLENDRNIIKVVGKCEKRASKPF